MPKMKTHRGAAKRFKKTASGYKRSHSHARHILTKKSTNLRGCLLFTTILHYMDVKAIKQMIG